jgi:nicotinate-nucleotide adenylyltransferase
MEFFRKAEGSPAKLGILSGSFHPPTRAHLELASAALSQVDEVLFVLPLVFPHKEYNRAGFAERLRMLMAATAGEPRYSVAATQGGLFIEIARECRQAYGPGPELLFLCGRDAAERIVNWDYGAPGAFAKMLEEFSLLVADRQGRYEPPPEMRHRIHQLELPDDLSDISATEVRRRVARGEPWEHLVPKQIVELVKQTYS